MFCQQHVLNKNQAEEITMTDIKLMLKEAREAIKNKDFQTSLRLCKSVLKKDKDNYMALVFLGLSLQEVGPKDQAPNAFRKAIQFNSSNTLAWNGLANYYEKLEGDTAKQELAKVYMRLLEIETSGSKLLEYCHKLANLGEHLDLLDIWTSIYKVTKCDKVSSGILVEISLLLTDLHAKIKDSPKELFPAQEEILSVVVSNQGTVSTEHYSAYLTVLYKQRKYKAVLEHAQRMSSIFESNLTSLNWMCKIYNESFVEGDEINSELTEHVNAACDKLLSLEPDSAMALFTRSIQMFKQHKILEAKDLLKKVTKSRPGLLHAWILLTECLIRLSLFDDALTSSLRADKLLSSASNSNKVLRLKLDQLILHVKSNSSDPSCWREIIEMYQNSNKGLEGNCLVDVIRAHINLEHYAIAEQLMKNSGDGIEKNVLTLLRAQMLHKQQHYSEALNLLEQNQPEMSEWWMEIATLYWDMEEHNKSLNPFLKAAKYDPDNYTCFLKLGDYYQFMDDTEKARRCYEKAFKLNDRCHEVVIKLSKMYRKQKMWEQNTRLLQTLSAAAPVNSENSWVYLQLGLSYLEQGNWDKAIENLRYVSRVNSSNGYVWESLADAYLSRGAYKSAQKCYQQAAELNSDSLYSLLQVATIKQIMGEYAEAIADFRAVLSDNKDYVPALKGLADTCLRQALQCFKDQRLGTARDYCQDAVDKVTLAIQQRSELSCLWKIMADCCLLVARLPEKHCCLFISPKFIDERSLDGANKLLEREELFCLATRCYSKAVTLMEDNMLLWYDLANCLLCSALSCKDSKNEQQLLLHKAFTCIQHCTLHNPTHWQHWNLLGNIVLNDPPNYALAQHAFIKAVTINHNSAIAWCNLGTLYLILDQVKLANKAFSTAQRCDPNYVNSWIGQALIAEAMGHHDAMDLFRHSTQLGVHQQGSIGYGHWVCKTLLESPPNVLTYSIHNMHAIPVACDALTWYTEKNPDDSCAWNMLGLLKERMGIKLSASEAFKNALHMSSREHRDCCRINYGRSLAALGNYTRAIGIFSDVEDASFSSASGLALCLFKSEQYEESYETYEQTLNWLTEEENKQSDLLVALASMLYMAQGHEAAKTLLFQSMQLKSPSPWAFYATLALAIIHKDDKLARVVLKELVNLKDNMDCLPHCALLLGYMYLLQGDYVKAVREVSKLIHRHPDQPSPWLTLSIVLLHCHQVRTPSTAAATSALMAMKLGLNNMDVTKVLCLVGLGFYLAGEYKEALLASQKAIHCYPDVVEAWSVLFVALKSCKTPNLNSDYVQKIMLHIQALRPSSLLTSWLKEQHV